MLKNLNQPPLRTAEHVAIIMDGNGRWAKARGMPRTFGHKAGVEAVRRTVKAAPVFGIRHLTLYAFSSENWARPPEEVRDLLGLLKLYIRRDLAELTANGVRIRIIGSRDNLPKDILSLIEGAEAKTAGNTQLNLNIAFNYGGRDEIVRAVQSIVEEKKRSASPVTTDDVSRALDTAHSPDPDLVIRTSGEVRLSNFLLWQIAYAEFVFLDCMWPDFDETQLRQALTEFTARDRRFGGVEAMKDAAL